MDGAAWARACAQIGVVAQRALARHGLADAPATNGEAGGAGHASSSRSDADMEAAAEAASDAEADAETPAAGRRIANAGGDGAGAAGRDGVELVRCVDVMGRDESYSEAEASPGLGPTAPASDKGGSSRRLVMRSGLGNRRFQQLDEGKREKTAPGGELSDELSIDDDEL